jgi:predicted transposase YbfD/YdcC
MRSWRKARRLVALCEQRQNRFRLEMARIERAHRQSLESDAQLQAQIVSLDALLCDQHGRTGLMDKSGLYEIRRHLAVLLSQKNDLRLERAEAARLQAELKQQLESERQQLLQAEKKRNK